MLSTILSPIRKEKQLLTERTLMLLIICSYSPADHGLSANIFDISKPCIGPWGRISAPFLPFRGVHGMLELLIYSSFGTSLIEQQDPFGEHDTTH